MENEVEGNLLTEGVRELGDSGEPNQWTINAGDGKENHLDNLLHPDSPSSLCPIDLVWEGGARRDKFIRSARFVP